MKHEFKQIKQPAEHQGPFKSFAGIEKLKRFSMSGHDFDG